MLVQHVQQGYKEFSEARLLHNNSQQPSPQDNLQTMESSNTHAKQMLVQCGFQRYQKVIEARWLHDY